MAKVTLFVASGCEPCAPIKEIPDQQLQDGLVVRGAGNIGPVQVSRVDITTEEGFKAVGQYDLQQVPQGVLTHDDGRWEKCELAIADGGKVTLLCGEEAALIDDLIEAEEAEQAAALGSAA